MNSLIGFILNRTVVPAAAIFALSDPSREPRQGVWPMTDEITEQFTSEVNRNPPV